ncbi:MAG: serine hydrolase [Proteobacteria bacterium]|nr:serine hydrolase [Pseudomonadota bacterium]
MDLSAALEPIRVEHRLPALAGLVLQKGEVIALGATGVRRRGSRTPVSVDDSWHLASCTKAMTATLAARLVERGDLRWDTRVEEAFPDLRDGMSPDYRPVRLTALLGHRAGVPGDITRFPIWSWLWSNRGSTAQERAELVATLLGMKPEAKPGTRHIYSNGGYTIAGAMTERAAGESWEALMRREVFEPLGMGSAGFGPPGADPADADTQPWGHSDQGRRALRPDDPRADNPAAIGPANAVHVSLRDWARFVAVHMDGGRAAGGYLREETFRVLHTPLDGQDYALGWIATDRPWGGGRVLTHAGSNTMWYVVVWMAPMRDFAVLVATNQGGDRAARGTDAAVGALIHWNQDSR